MMEPTQPTPADPNEIERLQTLLASDPTNVDARRELGALFDERGEPENAVREYIEILQNVPGNDSVRLDLITDLTDLGRLSEAEDELRKMTDPELDESSWWVDLGDAYQKQGMAAQAISAYKEALTLNPGRPAAREKLRLLAPQELKTLPKSLWARLARQAVVVLGVLISLSLLAGAAIFMMPRVQYLLTFGPSLLPRLYDRRVVLQANKPLTRAELETSAQELENRFRLVTNSTGDLWITPPDQIVAHLDASMEIPASILSSPENALLEFVDFGDEPINEGTVIRTSGAETVVATGTPIPPFAKTSADGQKIYRTVMTNQDLSAATLQFEQNTNKPIVAFTLSPRGREIFANYTTNHVGKYLGITLDKRVISSPVINSPISSGQGVIQGNFTIQEANTLIMQLTIQPLPAEFRIASDEVVPFFMP